MAGKLLESLQTDLSTRMYRVTNGFNEALYLVANEPSLGLYRMQEHIQTAIPKIVEQKQALLHVCQQVDGTCYDMEYDTHTVQGMTKVSQFPSISANIMKAVELKAKLDALESTRKQRIPPHVNSTPAQIQGYGSIQQSHSKKADGLIPKVFN